MPLHFLRNSLIDRLFRRLISYSGVGIGTYLLDIAVILLLYRVWQVDPATAIALGFLVGVTVNYLLCYFWVYRGTHRNFKIGLAIFLCLALVGVALITESVTYLVLVHGMPLLLARTLVAAFVGLVNFLLNTFFNFKLV